MKFKGFEKEDFDLFLIEGLEERMSVLINQLRPKFYHLGDDLKNELGHIVGDEIFPHVAKHARRKTNPPDDSWVAFASNQRGYKMMPHFQICLWSSHVLIQWGIIYEAKNKKVFADNMLIHVEAIRKAIPHDYHFFKDHMKPEGVRLKDLTDGEIREYARRLKENKNGEIMVGKVIPKEEALVMSSKQFVEIVLETWMNLDYLHRLAK